MYIEKHGEIIESENMQIENSRVEENEEEIMNLFLQILHIQRKI
jgi:hypothetical protein